MLFPEFLFLPFSLPLNIFHLPSRPPSLNSVPPSLSRPNSFKLPPSYIATRPPELYNFKTMRELAERTWRIYKKEDASEVSITGHIATSNTEDRNGFCLPVLWCWFGEKKASSCILLSVVFEMKRL